MSVIVLPDFKRYTKGIDKKVEGSLNNGTMGRFLFLGPEGIDERSANRELGDFFKYCKENEKKFRYVFGNIGHIELKEAATVKGLETITSRKLIASFASFGGK
eukprot:gnl/Chilomastix_caulleri/1086.p2 GENE.gnl/Chilomastix_caulleri/1086~~gnl/Chilomastix_caulleri/1086.p2  ORF type:complete len:103 (+),score=36.41 gnl/Chilomastix_caulleri/1086:286-594(+)